MPITDLINKFNELSADERKILRDKYAYILEPYANLESHLPILSFIIDIAIKYLKENYDVVLPYWKAFIVLVIVKLYFNKKLIFIEDITTTINNFLIYHNTNYQNYIDNLAYSINDYDRDLIFVSGFISKNNLDV
jgi:hypothetical protein